MSFWVQWQWKCCETKWYVSREQLNDDDDNDDNDDDDDDY